MVEAALSEEDIRQLRRVLAIGQANRRYYLARGVPETRIFEMPYAVDNEFFGKLADGADLSLLRQDLGLPPNGKTVLFAGKFSRRKRPDLLLSAWLEADWAPGGRPALLMVGDGEMRRELEKRAPEDVHFPGFVNQSHLPALYALADLFVLPSGREPWGLAVNEAMACGTPAIATDQCGAAFDLIDEKTGWIVEADDGRALANILPAALAQSAERGKATRQRIATWNFEADLAGLKNALRAVA